MPFRDDAEALRTRLADLEGRHARQSIELERLRRQNRKDDGVPRAMGGRLAWRAAGIAIAGSGLVAVVGIAWSGQGQPAATTMRREARPAPDAMRPAPAGPATRGTLVRTRVTVSPPGSATEPGDACTVVVAFDDEGTSCAAVLQCFARDDARPTVTCEVDERAALQRVRPAHDAPFPTIALDLQRATLAIHWTEAELSTDALVVAVTPFVMP